MDSVPYIFCEDVLERLPRTNLCTIAKHLSGQWRSAAQRFIEKHRSLLVAISKDSEGWWYGVEDENTWENIENGPHSHEEFLSMDRKYVEIRKIVIYIDPGQFNARDFRCSKEEIARRVVPFLTLRMQPDSTLSFPEDCPKEIVLECLNMFRGCFSFGDLDLLHVGPESEEFLALQLKKNPLLCGLMLRRWPHTETTEQLVLTFLNSRKKRALNMAQYSDIQSFLKVTIEFVTAAVDSWVSGSERRALFMYGPIDVTPEEILSIPVPENVTKREEQGQREGDFCVRWSKEDGSSLKCELRVAHDCAVIDSSADWYHSPFY
ncbi:hypothetical protein QR680_010402 [Steinernema hermaphroditum]|uniref:F-box domain-containing protein n=1 Tax=Steinernema hermaphroditum TaxID=289476 RepID=A0AA39MAM0_9BILA|nr:hypothetical protein QR680_010402 [Steinernema hermaphroditum]